MSDTDLHDETELEVSEEPHPMTVRDLINLISGLAPSLDSTVSCVTENGGNTVVFSIIGAHSHPMELDNDDSGDLVLYVDFPFAWNTETKENLDAGVLVLEGDLD